MEATFCSLAPTHMTNMEPLVTAAFNKRPLGRRWIDRSKAYTLRGLGPIPRRWQPSAAPHPTLFNGPRYTATQRSTALGLMYVLAPEKLRQASHQVKYAQISPRLS
jgi:hypothetical protein